jgi:hypothetical protein
LRCNFSINSLSKTCLFEFIIRFLDQYCKYIVNYPGGNVLHVWIIISAPQISGIGWGFSFYGSPTMV